MITLTGSVGIGASNQRADVVAIQEALSQLPAGQGGRVPPLRPDGIAGPKTKSAIIDFQQHHFRWSDGRVSTRGPTLRALNRAINPAAPPAGVPPLSRSEIQRMHDAPEVAAPASRAGVMARVTLMSGECFITHHMGRTRLVGGRSYPVVGGERLTNSEGGRCKLMYLDGTIVMFGPGEFLAIIHGGPRERVRAEGSRPTVRAGSDLSRLRALSGE